MMITSLKRFLLFSVFFAATAFGQTSTPTMTATPTPTNTLAPTPTPVIGSMFGRRGDPYDNTKNYNKTYFRTDSIFSEGWSVAEPQETRAYEPYARPVLDYNGQGTSDILNFISNPDFPAAISPWTDDANVTATYSGSFSDISTSSSGSMKLVADGVATATAQYDLSEYIERADYYTFGFRIKQTTEDITVSLLIECTSPEQTFTKTYTVLSTDEPWQQLSVTAQLPADSYLEAVEINTDDECTFYVDNVGVYRSAHWPGFLAPFSTASDLSVASLTADDLTVKRVTASTIINATSIKAIDTDGIQFYGSAGTLRGKFDSNGTLIVGTGGTGASGRVMNLYRDTSSTVPLGYYEEDGTGDANVSYVLTGIYSYSTGIDNSDSDKFQICRGSTLGTNPAITINTSGNVGVNTASPGSYALDVSGAVNTSGAATIGGNTTVTGYVDASNYGEFGNSTNTLTVYQSPLAFRTMGTDSWTFTAPGNEYKPVGSVEQSIAAQVPNYNPGTLLQTVRCIWYLDHDTDQVNFSAQYHTITAPGTVTSIVAKDGSGWNRTSGVTNITGNYYYKDFTLAHTVVAGQSVYITVYMDPAGALDGCSFVGAYYTIYQRRY